MWLTALAEQVENGLETTKMCMKETQYGEQKMYALMSRHSFMHDDDLAYFVR